MATQTDEKEAAKIEELTREAETLLEKEDSRKDLKEKREFLKQTFYNGPKKTKLDFRYTALYSHRRSGLWSSYLIVDHA